jgi:hypothetical protein
LGSYVDYKEIIQYLYHPIFAITDGNTQELYSISIDDKVLLHPTNYSILKIEVLVDWTSAANLEYWVVNGRIKSTLAIHKLS